MSAKFALDTVSLATPGSAFRTQIRRGQAWHAEHPLVLHYPDLFSDEPPDVFPHGWEPEVEQATAAPGEKRATRRAS